MRKQMRPEPGGNWIFFKDFDLMQKTGSACRAAKSEAKYQMA